MSRAQAQAQAQAQQQLQQLSGIDDFFLRATSVQSPELMTRETAISGEGIQPSQSEANVVANNTRSRSLRNTAVLTNGVTKKRWSKNRMS